MPFLCIVVNCFPMRTCYSNSIRILIMVTVHINLCNIYKTIYDGGSHYRHGTLKAKVTYIPHTSLIPLEELLFFLPSHI